TVVKNRASSSRPASTSPGYTARTKYRGILIHNGLMRDFKRKSMVGVITLVMALAFFGLTVFGSANANAATHASKSARGAAKHTLETPGKGVKKAALEKTIETALGVSTPAAKLPPIMVQALKVATKPLSAAKLQKAIACWKATSCTLGSGKLVVAEADGWDVNDWRAFVKMNVILQALEYPQIGKFIFTNGEGNLSTYDSDIRELAAEGVKIIVTFNTFGAAAYPAFKAAQKEGAYISEFVDPTTPAPRSALTTVVQPTICAAGKNMATVAKKLKATNAAYFIGVPGNPEDAGVDTCATKSGLHPVFSAATTWTPAGAEKAASALIASRKPAKSILYTYSTPVPNIVDAYVAAGQTKSIPAIITFTTNNSTVCLLKKYKFPLYVTDAYNWAVRISLTALVDKYEGKSVPKDIYYPLPFHAATASSCTAAAPGAFPGLSSLVPASVAKQMLKS
ncbi:MAG: substrate-binding domain-containing protein, partial [Acidimicrobiales bacterium]